MQKLNSQILKGYIAFWLVLIVMFYEVSIKENKKGSWR